MRPQTHVDHAVTIIRTLADYDVCLTHAGISRISGVGFSAVHTTCSMLVKAGIVISFNGPCGGTKLLKRDVTLYDVMLAVSRKVDTYTDPHIAAKHIRFLKGVKLCK